MADYPRSRSRQDYRSGLAAGRAAAALAFATAFAELVPDVSLRSREDAERLRARVTAVFEPLVGHPAFDETMLPPLLDLYGAVIAYLSRRGLDLRPLALVTARERLPSTVLATQLYRDPRRADELVEMNDVATAFFMPLAIEAERPEGA